MMMETIPDCDGGDHRLLQEDDGHDERLLFRAITSSR